MAIAAVRPFVRLHALFMMAEPHVTEPKSRRSLLNHYKHTHVTPVYGFIVLHHRQWSLSSIKEIIICTSVTILHCSHTNAYARKLHSIYLHLVIRRQKLTHTKPKQTKATAAIKTFTVIFISTFLYSLTTQRYLVSFHSFLICSHVILAALAYIQIFQLHEVTRCIIDNQNDGDNNSTNNNHKP